ncbi:MAG: hypothetical protein JXA38_03525, partial [Methanosarcinaceae archaeon]|nr:hypothetical protein [Methanosarcinaceae archaeon]
MELIASFFEPSFTSPQPLPLFPKVSNGYYILILQCKLLDVDCSIDIPIVFCIALSNKKERLLALPLLRTERA